MLASASKSPVNPSVRTAAASESRLAADMLTPAGAFTSSKLLTVSPATYVVRESVTVTVAPPTLLSVRGVSLCAVIAAEGAAGVADTVSLAGPSGALATTARTWKSYACPFARLPTVASVVSAALPLTAVHEPHTESLVSLYRYSHPVIAEFPGSVQLSTAPRFPPAAESPVGAAGATSATASTSISPVSRSPLSACPVPFTVTLSFASESKSVPS